MANPTNQQIRDLLTDLGFESRPGVEPKSVVFEHSASGARFWLPSNRQQEHARPEDIHAIRTHLHYRGLLDEAEFDRFVSDDRRKAS